MSAATRCRELGIVARAGFAGLIEGMMRRSCACPHFVIRRRLITLTKHLQLSFLRDLEFCGWLLRCGLRNKAVSSPWQVAAIRRLDGRKMVGAYACVLNHRAVLAAAMIEICVKYLFALRLEPLQVPSFGLFREFKPIEVDSQLC